MYYCMGIIYDCLIIPDEAKIHILVDVLWFPELSFLLCGPKKLGIPFTISSILSIPCCHFPKIINQHWALRPHSMASYNKEQPQDKLAKGTRLGTSAQREARNEVDWNPSTSANIQTHPRSWEYKSSAISSSSLELILTTIIPDAYI